MTIDAGDLILYAGALLVLFFTPGPVWLALLARTLSGGFAAALPLALGVVVGDVLWPLAAIHGLTWVISVYSDTLLVLRWVAAIFFVAMGLQLIRHADRAIQSDGRLTRPGFWPGFTAGLAAILGNPKAALFYLGLLPGFFDLGRVTGLDIGVIVGVTMIIPFLGNMIFAVGIDRLRQLIQSPAALKRVNQVAGVLMILVGVVIGVPSLYE
ncbi:LysE family translocator [Spiribacter vilamensis]|uniref:Threonine/homoserine/homoserine lactone efflux protein n=1 Tax=Spiribacter vilamensis TaxID=531306 RepID=A0A4Q8D0J2_9GAMM|nr:LysE family translocator [Spiribacter vilamensis]RZU98747.1 threonine/homoserine/homoserine lactone efflux protein [Spiribacter vilamensis]TVO62230.1 LysE family translocator [Spiribacter vilamensis]